MPKFNKNNVRELVESLYNSYAHDAKINSIRYDNTEDELKIEVINPIFNVKTAFSFKDIDLVLSIKGREYGSRKTIISLTAEKDFSYLQDYLPKCGEDFDDSLYLLFQMFSGDELHIVSKEVSVDVID